MERNNIILRFRFDHIEKNRFNSKISDSNIYIGRFSSYWQNFWDNNAIFIATDDFGLKLSCLSTQNFQNLQILKKVKTKVISNRYEMLPRTVWLFSCLTSCWFANLLLTSIDPELCKIWNLLPHPSVTKLQNILVFDNFIEMLPRYCSLCENYSTG